jgi:hypothetical protein
MCDFVATNLATTILATAKCIEAEITDLGNRFRRDLRKKPT